MLEYQCFWLVVLFFHCLIAYNAYVKINVFTLYNATKYMPNLGPPSMPHPPV